MVCNRPPVHEHIVDLKYCPTAITFTDEVGVQAVVGLYLTTTIVQVNYMWSEKWTRAKVLFLLVCLRLGRCILSEDFPDGAIL